MLWEVEYIADQANILINDPTKPKDEWEPVGMGMPQKFAENIVRLHNEAIEKLRKRNVGVLGEEDVPH